MESSGETVGEEHVTRVFETIEKMPLFAVTHRRNPELINHALFFRERAIVRHNREAYQSPKEITSG